MTPTTIDFQTLVRKKLAVQTAKLWIEELNTSTLHLFTRDYNYVTLYKAYSRRWEIEEKQKKLFFKTLSFEIEKELKLNSKFHLCQRQVPDRILKLCYDKTGINFDAVLPNTHSITNIGGKRVEFYVNNVRLFSKKIVVL